MQNAAEALLAEVNRHRRRLRLEPSEVEERALEQDWAAEPHWATGLLLAAFGNPAYLPWAVLNLPDRQNPAYRFFVPLLEKMVRFPSGANPSKDAKAAVDWLKTTTLNFDGGVGRYSVVSVNTHRT